MFRFRFQPLIQLRENERDAARSALADAFTALAQLEHRLAELEDERKSLDQQSSKQRTGAISVDRLLSHGRYERQLAAEIVQVRTTIEKVEAEIVRRQLVLTEANSGVRQMELLKQRELEAWQFAVAKTEQASMDEFASQAHRRRSVGTNAKQIAANEMETS